jgi:hypothetical protein
MEEQVPRQNRFYSVAAASPSFDDAAVRSAPNPNLGPSGPRREKDAIKEESCRQ